MSGGGSLSTWGIRNPVPAMMLFFVLCVAGPVSYTHLTLPTSDLV